MLPHLVQLLNKTLQRRENVMTGQLIKLNVAIHTVIHVQILHFYGALLQN